MTRSPGQILLLHGASSAGKSTLARAVQRLHPRVLWHMSIDKLRDGNVLPMDRIKGGDFDWSELRQPVFDGFHSSLAAVAQAGNDLIVEHILDDAAMRAGFETAVAGLDIFRVGLHTPLEVMIAREAERGDRPVGSAAQDHARVHDNMQYDLTLDGTQDPNRNARTIIDAWPCQRIP